MNENNVFNNQKVTSTSQNSLLIIMRIQGSLILQIANLISAEIKKEKRETDRYIERSVGISAESRLQLTWLLA